MASAQQGLHISDPGAYREKLFGLVGGREPLEVMSETAATLEEIVRTHPVEVLRARPFEGKWTPNEILGHLTDGEWVYGYRLRLILCEETPTILGMNQNQWVDKLKYNDWEPAAHVAAFRTMRDFNLGIWRRATPEDLQRVGMHNERGPESLELMLRLLAGHDLSHVDQIRRYIAAVGHAK